MGTKEELATFTSTHDVVITTERLKLRPIYPLTDIYVVHRMRTNPNSMRYSTTGVETEEDPFKCASFNRMKLMAAPGSFSFAIELLPSGSDAPEIIGCLGLFHPPACGYLLDEPYWGKGYATEALRGFVQMYWEHFPEGAPGLRPEERDILQAHVLEGNVPSERVLQKAGFRELRKDVMDLPSGQKVNETVFELARPDKVQVPAGAPGLPN